MLNSLIYYTFQLIDWIKHKLLVFVIDKYCNFQITQLPSISTIEIGDFMMFRILFTKFFISIKIPPVKLTCRSATPREWIDAMNFHSSCEYGYAFANNI